MQRLVLGEELHLPVAHLDGALAPALQPCRDPLHVLIGRHDSHADGRGRRPRPPRHGVLGPAAELEDPGLEAHGRRLEGREALEGGRVRGPRPEHLLTVRLLAEPAEASESAPLQPRSPHPEVVAGEDVEGQRDRLEQHALRLGPREGHDGLLVRPRPQPEGEVGVPLEPELVGPGHVELRPAIGPEHRGEEGRGDQPITIDLDAVCRLAASAPLADGDAGPGARETPRDRQAEVHPRALDHDERTAPHVPEDRLVEPEVVRERHRGLGGDDLGALARHEVDRLAQVADDQQRALVLREGRQLEGVAVAGPLGPHRSAAQVERRDLRMSARALVEVEAHGARLLDRNDPSVLEAVEAREGVALDRREGRRPARERVPRHLGQGEGEGQGARHGDGGEGRGATMPRRRQRVREVVVPEVPLPLGHGGRHELGAARELRRIARELEHAEEPVTPGRVAEGHLPGHLAQVPVAQVPAGQGSRDHDGRDRQGHAEEQPSEERVRVEQPVQRGDDEERRDQRRQRHREVLGQLGPPHRPAVRAEIPLEALGEGRRPCLGSGHGEAERAVPVPRTLAAQRCPRSLGRSGLQVTSDGVSETQALPWLA